MWYFWICWINIFLFQLANTLKYKLKKKWLDSYLKTGEQSFNSRVNSYAFSHVIVVDTVIQKVNFIRTNYRKWDKHSRSFCDRERLRTTNFNLKVTNVQGMLANEVEMTKVYGRGGRVGMWWFSLSELARVQEKKTSAINKKYLIHSDFFLICAGSTRALSLQKLFSI